MKKKNNTVKVLVGVVVIAVLFALIFGERVKPEEKTVVTETTQTEAKKETDETITETTEEIKEVKKDEKIVYKQDEWWEVDGQWRLKVNNVTTTDERNQFSDKEPAQVVIIDYTYENLGYESDFQDLFMIPEKVIDSQKKMAEPYPASGKGDPQPTPPGAMTENATYVYGLNNEGGPITIIFEEYDNDSNLQKATFEIDITE
ncbi:hypothetical protein [Vagococcus lutrae]|uniref:hypothetical protein n=1 Tax=Vagococcus lutrae TaxID=81947 RepID=UPI002097B612|nr:hypothetical protein [Vagococcus lutrae]MCO7151880.1 hypothetical protein [Vagococcus lutrae]